MGLKKYDSISDALKEMKPGDYRNIRVRDSIVTMRKGNEYNNDPVNLVTNLHKPEKKAKIITK